MRNTLKYLLSAAASCAVLASCDINKPDIFDDANAFVAFDNATMAVDEDYSKDGTTLKIPVTLASVAGISESVSFEVKDGTAKAGVDYELVTTSGVLTFDKENRTRNIEVRIIENPKYTGDQTFTIGFKETNSVNEGAENTCTVTIRDLNHPLSGLFGTYTFTGKSYFDDGQEMTWTATFSKDAEDDSMIWMLNLPYFSGGWEGFGINFYGVVDEEMTTITIPFGQLSPGYIYGGGDPDVQLLGLDAELNDYETGSMTVKIIKDDSGKVTGLDCGDQYGLYCWIVDTGDLSVVMPGITAVKD